MRDGIKTYYKSKGGKAIIYHADCMDIASIIPQESIDMIFADPPYFLSGKGTTCSGGKRVSVNKGKWDEPRGIEDIHTWNTQWLRVYRDLLKDTGTIWISGTRHNIFSVGLALQQIGYKVLNDIVWEKIAPPPNLSCRYFTHASETILWAAKHDKAKYKFNYADMKVANNNKQMKSVWKIGTPKKIEKKHGKHPTQKPLELLERIILASTDPGDTVLDPFSGSASTGLACIKHGRKYIGIEKDLEYCKLSVKRLKDEEANTKTI